MDTLYNLEQKSTDKDEIEKVRSLLAKNIDDFKHLVLFNMRLEEKSKSLNQEIKSNTVPLRADINRLTDFDQKTTESLEDWVAREFAHQNVAKKDPKQAAIERVRANSTFEVPGETLEQWVARQGKLKSEPKIKTTKTVIDFVEEWLMNEAKKDIFADMDAKFGGTEELSSDYIRDLGATLIALADKIDRLKTKAEELK